MLTLSLAVTAAALAQQPAGGAPATPESLVSRENVMAHLAALPTARAAKGNIAAQEGLAATETLLVAKLKEFGYEPVLEPLSWNLFKQARQDELLQKQQFMEGIMDEKRGKKPAPTGPDSKPAEGGRPPEKPDGGAPRTDAAPQPPAKDPAEERQPSGDKPAGPPKAPPLPETTPDLAKRTWHNIIVELPGTDLPKEVLIVGAHFDAVAGTPGADDNGSGTAALLEAARVLKDYKPRRTVRLIFFNLEEIGLLGSRDHAKRYKARLDAGLEKMVGMVSLETIGYYSTEPNSQKSPVPRIEGVFDPPTTGDFIAIATIKKHSPFARAWAAGMTAAAPEMKVVVADMLPFAPPDFLRSDHAPFHAIGQPNLMLTDTANFRNPHYHKPTDTIATIDAERFTQTTRGIVGAIRAVADGKGTSAAPARKEPPAAEPK